MKHRKVYFAVKVPVLVHPLGALDTRTVRACPRARRPATPLKRGSEKKNCLPFPRCRSRVYRRRLGPSAAPLRALSTPPDRPTSPRRTGRAEGP